MVYEADLYLRSPEDTGFLPDINLRFRLWHLILSLLDSTAKSHGLPCFTHGDRDVLFSSCQFTGEESMSCLSLQGISYNTTP